MKSAILPYWSGAIVGVIEVANFHFFFEPVTPLPANVPSPGNVLSPLASERIARALAGK